jgi:hypothetical protein
MDGATINMTNIDQPKFCLRTRSPMKGNGNPNFEATTIRGLSQRTCYTVLRMKLGVQKYGMTNDFSDSNVWETRQPAQWRWILTLSNQDMYRYVISLLNRTTFGRMEVNGTEPTQKSVFHSRWHKDIIEPSPRLCAFPRRARLDPWPRQQVVPRRQAALGLRGWRGQHHCWNTALANQKMLGDWWWSFHLLAFCWKSGITPLRQVGLCQIAIFPLKFQALPQFLDHPILAPDRFTGKPSAHRTGRPRYLLYLGFFRKWGISPKWQWYIMIFYDDKLATFGVQHFQTMSRTCS